MSEQITLDAATLSAIIRAAQGGTRDVASRRKPKPLTREERELAEARKGIIALGAALPTCTRAELRERATLLAEFVAEMEAAVGELDTAIGAPRGMNQLERDEARRAWRELTDLMTQARLAIYAISCEAASRRVGHVGRRGEQLAPEEILNPADYPQLANAEKQRVLRTDCASLNVSA